MSKQTTTGQKERDAANQEQSQLLFMAILILKWYLMSHQARTDLSRSRGTIHTLLSALLSVGLAIVGIRIHTCVFVLPLLPATPIYHTGVQTTVSSYRMVHHGVSVTYTLFGYPASRPRLLPSFSFLIRAVYARLRLTRSLDEARFVPAPSILAGQDVLRNANVCIPHARPSGVTIIDVRPFSFFVITPLPLLIYQFEGSWILICSISNGGGEEERK